MLLYVFNILNNTEIEKQLYHSEIDGRSGLIRMILNGKK